MNLELYEKLLKKTASKYSFEKINITLNEIELLEKDKPVCFLRHDIDFSPVNAARVAALEKQLGIYSTYTILLSGLYYNPFEKHNRKLIKEIKSYGHEVGLHFDPNVHDISDEASLEMQIKKETSALENLVDAPISMFSFHNTTEFSMNCRNREYGGLLNAYSNFFHNDVEYTSDSNGYWRFRSWEELLSENHKIIQVLTHPMWWKPKNELPPFETFVKNLVERFDFGLDKYIKLFSDQDIRINKSSLDELLVKFDKINDPKILGSYAKLNILADILRSNEDEELISRLHEIIRDLKLQ
jgi:hypothetical protein